MSQAAPAAIGGYFELDGRPPHTPPLPHALALQSARAAFTLLLQELRPARIWMPWYQCATMLEVPARLGIAVTHYALDRQWLPQRLPRPRSDALLLYVNYFGLAEQQLRMLWSRFDARRVIVDCAQAFYAPSPLLADALAVLYSPRKFFGVPDGGYLVTRHRLTPPARQDRGSLRRLQPLLRRLANGAEAGYAASLAARRSLERQAPQRMSALTAALLARVDYGAARRRRNFNYRQLDAALATDNHCSLHAAVINGPLCYPYRSARPGLHAWLARARIYAGHYWPHLLRDDSPAPRNERRLAAELVPLPCDQRYGAADMRRVIAAVRAFERGAREP